MKTREGAPAGIKTPLSRHSTWSPPWPCHSMQALPASLPSHSGPWLHSSHLTPSFPKSQIWMAELRDATAPVCSCFILTLTLFCAFLTLKLPLPPYPHVSRIAVSFLPKSGVTILSPEEPKESFLQLRKWTPSIFSLTSCLGTCIRTLFSLKLSWTLTLNFFPLHKK